MKDKKIKVLVVDDSAYIRALLTEILNSDSRLTVVASAADPYEARELIKKHNPQVLTLDIEMPKMNGIAFLKNLMRLRPMPVVMISTLTQEGAPSTLEALELGAVDFLAKPGADGEGDLEYYANLIIEKVINASQANMSARERSKDREEKSVQEFSDIKGKHLSPMFICGIGASTGGTEAIKSVVTRLPERSPPVVVTQHIPGAFSTSFARRVDACSRVNVYEASHNQTIEAGNVYIAPGDSHLRVSKHGGRYVCVLNKEAPVHRHRPSVSVLFDSILESAGNNAMGILLTGMGADGADALLRMKQASCFTVVQDEATSVVWGMPGAAVKLGAAEKIMPLTKIAGSIINQAYK